jgi:hypothetical protein
VNDVCRTLPTFEKTDLGHVRQQSVKKFLIEHVVNVKTLNVRRSFFSFFLLKMRSLEAKVKF